ncbi:hypothetical protein D3C79_850150 [compost metagenome]
MLAMLLARLAGLHANYRPVHGPVLLIAAHGLDGLAARLHEQHEVLQHIQQVGRLQQPGDQALLLRQHRFAQRLRHLDLAARAIGADHRLPLGVVLKGRAHAAHPSLVKAGGHQQLIGSKQGLVALVVIHLKRRLALVAVAPQLVHGLGQWLGH